MSDNLTFTLTFAGNANPETIKRAQELLSTISGAAVFVDDTPKTSEEHGVTDSLTTAELKERAACDEKISKTEVVRERGKPAPGRARRTKEEIAEDEAADKADAALSTIATEADIQTNNPADVKAAISTGDERINPEEEAQDAADEKAEADANRDGLTHDDLRRAVGRYNKAYGMAASVEDIPSILGCGIVDVPETELANAIAKVEQAIELNPLGRGVVGAPAKEAPKAEEKTVARTATKDEVVKAMLAYALKFDGQNTDMSKMDHTNVDCPKIFAMLFGDGVTKLSQIPATPEAYGNVVAGIEEAIAKNPFNR